MSVDLIARALAVTATPVATSAEAISTLRLASTVGFIQTGGYSVSGKGAGFYVSDALATAGLAAAHPRFCKQSADGRYWRLLPDGEGLIQVAAGGASATAAADNSANQQPAIDAARAYCEAIGAGGLAFEDGFYSIWTPLRTEAPAAGVNFSINANQTGVPFVLTKRQKWQAGPRGTFFTRRKNNGTAPSAFAGTQQLSNGQYWRGGMWLFKGTAGAPGNRLDAAALTLRGAWDIDGGMGAKSGVGLLPLTGGIYVLDGAGNGWDISDKAVWGENDRYYGDFETDGHVKIHGFRGELVYHGSYGNIRVRGALELADTDGNGFNPGPWGHMRIDTLILRGCYNGLEQSTGDEDSWIGNLTIEDCGSAGGLRAGKQGDGPAAPNPTATFRIDNLRASRSLQFVMGRYTHIAKAVLFDMEFWVGQNTDGSSGNMNCIGSTVDDLTVLADRANVGIACYFHSESATAGTKGTYRNRIGRLTTGRTPYGAANGKSVAFAASGGNSLGPLNFIGEILGEAGSYPNAAGVVDHPIGFGPIRADWLVNSFGHYQNLDVSANLDYRWSPKLTTYQASAPVAGLKAVTLVNNGGATPPPNGSLWTITNGGTIPLAVQNTNTRMTHPALVPLGAAIQFEFDGTYWKLLTGRFALRGSVTANLQKGGAAIPANDVSDETTLTVAGAAVGMQVQVACPSAISGDAALAGRVSAADTVKIRAKNMNAGATLALGSQTYDVEVRYV